MAREAAPWAAAEAGTGWRKAAGDLSGLQTCPAPRAGQLGQLTESRCQLGQG